MGLHFNIPEASIPDAATREHLRRVWWTSYILEIICAVNAGQMLRIEDDEVLVDPPTNAGLAEADQADFSDFGCMCATIRLVKLLRGIRSSLNGRGRHDEPFLRRVQAALRDLKHWHQSLPENLLVDTTSSHCRREDVKSLHLLFNQVSNSPIGFRRAEDVLTLVVRDHHHSSSSPGHGPTAPKRKSCWTSKDEHGYFRCFRCTVTSVRKLSKTHLLNPNAVVDWRVIQDIRLHPDPVSVFRSHDTRRI